MRGMERLVPDAIIDSNDTALPEPPPDTASADTTSAGTASAALVPMGSRAVAPKAAPTEFVVESSAQRGGLHLGRLLESARRRIGLSEQAAANRVRVSVHEIYDFESGLRTPSQTLVELMCEAYGIEPARLASDVGMALGDGPQPNKLFIAWYEVDLAEIDDAERLRRIGVTFRRLRSLSEERPVTIRDDELVLISRIIDTNDTNLPSHLARAFGIDATHAEVVAARLRHHADQNQIASTPAELAPPPSTPTP